MQVRDFHRNALISADDGDAKQHVLGLSKVVKLLDR